MKDQLKRILNLVQKTGDTMIVTDPNGDDVYVVMGLDQYENLRNIDNFDPDAESDDLEKFPTGFQDDIDWTQDDVAVSIPGEDVNGLSGNSSDIWSVMRPAGETGDTWDLAKISEDEAVNLEEQYKKYTQEPKTPIDLMIESESKIEEISPKLDENEDEFGEEQFYLEPID